MEIKVATRSYEVWMHDCGPVVQPHLQLKHRKMKQDAFQFFRGTYYCWAQAWPEVCPECITAPQVICVGDLHVDSYGTWPVAEGRLCWGVDDFDEAHLLPYTNDLVRLAASAKIARKLGLLTLTTRTAREAVLDGYQQSLKNDGCPIVLAELERDLEKLGIGALENTKELAKQEFELASFGSSPNGGDHISRLEGVPHLSRGRRNHFLYGLIIVNFPIEF